ncbi:MAG: tyrosine-type recombinase/integrase, partial [Saezia sp.]
MPFLTVKSLEAAKPKDKPYKLTVDKGLYLHVPLTGVKTWLVRFVVNGEQRQVTLPQPFGSSGKNFITVAQACAENAKIQQLANQGIDFRFLSKQEKDEKVKEQIRVETEYETFNTLFKVWLKDGVFRKDGNAELQRSFEKDVLPFIGNTPIKDVTEEDIRSILHKIIKRGSNRKAKIIHSELIQVLGWAEKRKPWRALLIEGNPASLINVQQMVGNDYDVRGIRDRILSEEEIKELHNRLAELDRHYQNAKAGEKYKTPKPVSKERQLIIWLCLFTLCRIGELISAEWKNVNLEKGEWFIPIESVKGQIGMKQSHMVFLSP